MIHHDAVTHVEKVEIAPAYSYPKYETHTLCKKCGYDFTAHGEPAIGGNCPNKCGAGTRGESVYVGEYTEPALYEDQTIIDQVAWDEEVTTYRCSCGATKN